ncbi:biogenesis of lysosome-related organelles complex 1, subunit 3 [Arctopsyche grandis]|uniref:biogenesis of lysosome-related organelles complex 1, subunit 3 n=1 Tax=Arctopsyche grandis TaxID=121162 RepID=UPI00406D809E
MSLSASVIHGEAAESDSEDIPERHHTSNARILHGAIVLGEASESDEEYTPSAASRVTTHIQSNTTPSPRSHNSLLHKKLYECNMSLYGNVLNHLRSTVKNSLTQLSSIDQQLLKSQLRLQNASTALKTLEHNSNHLAERLNNAACTAYIPKMTIPVIETDSD